MAGGNKNQGQVNNNDTMDGRSDTQKRNREPLYSTRYLTSGSIWPINKLGSGLESLRTFGDRLAGGIVGQIPLVGGIAKGLVNLAFAIVGAGLGLGLKLVSGILRVARWPFKKAYEAITGKGKSQDANTAEKEETKEKTNEAEKETERQKEKELDKEKTKETEKQKEHQTALDEEKDLKKQAETLDGVNNRPGMQPNQELGQNHPESGDLEALKENQELRKQIAELQKKVDDLQRAKQNPENNRNASREEQLAAKREEAFRQHPDAQYIQFDENGNYVRSIGSVREQQRNNERIREENNRQAQQQQAQNENRPSELGERYYMEAPAKDAYGNLTGTPMGVVADHASNAEQTLNGFKAQNGGQIPDLAKLEKDKPHDYELFVIAATDKYIDTLARDGQLRKEKGLNPTGTIEEIMNSAGKNKNGEQLGDANALYEGMRNELKPFVEKALKNGQSKGKDVMKDNRTLLESVSKTYQKEQRRERNRSNLSKANTRQRNNGEPQINSINNMK